MDWLESRNNEKMWMNWKKKTTRFKHEGARITLRGVQSNLDSCSAISASLLPGTKPINVKQYRYAPHKRQKLNGK
jgi:hypothetical protein